jgi:hypothetical protein
MQIGAPLFAKTWGSTLARPNAAVLPDQAASGASHPCRLVRQVIDAATAWLNVAQFVSHFLQRAKCLNLFSAKCRLALGVESFNTFSQVVGLT